MTGCRFASLKLLRKALVHAQHDNRLTQIIFKGQSAPSPTQPFSITAAPPDPSTYLGYTRDTPWPHRAHSETFVPSYWGGGGDCREAAHRHSLPLPPTLPHPSQVLLRGRGLELRQADTPSLSSGR